MNDATRTLEPFIGQWAVLLTTYKRDGTPVGTAVNIAVEGDLAYFRTWDTAWKMRRMRNNPHVTVAHDLHGVRGLDRRDDALGARQDGEGIEHLVVFPMYKQNASRDTCLEALITRTPWPDFVAELERGGGRYGLQVMCEGGGMANATVLERLDG
jgi:hypothetical protein